MRVVLLSARRLRPDQVENVIDALGITAADHADLRLVSWGRPIGRLPVSEHIVVGPDPMARIRSVPVADAAHSLAEPLAAHGESDAPPVETEEDALGPSAAVALDTEPEFTETTSPAARTGAARVRHALTWRTNRVRLAVRRHPATQRFLGSTKVRKVATKVTPGGHSGQFAVRAARSPRIRWLCGQATVIVSIDQHAQRAAWLLARRVPEVPIVVGLPAAKQILDASRQR